VGVARGAARRRAVGAAGVARALAPPPRPAPAGGPLRLDHDRPAKLLGRLARLFRRGGQAPLGDRNPDPPEEILALVLVEVHRRRTLTMRRRWTAQFGPERLL